MLNLLRFLPLLSLIFLPACQPNVNTQAEQSFLSAKKANEAAIYNTQLGMAYLKQGDMPRAKRKLLTAYELSPNSADVNVAMAYYLEKTGDVNRAKAFYHKALSLAPNSGAQLNNYGTFLCRQGSYSEADRYFIKAVNDVSYVHTAAAYENAGLCAAAIPNYAKAEQYFVKALQHDPRRKQSLYELVSLTMKEKKPKIALMYLKKYANLSKNDPTLINMAIESAHQAGKTTVESDYKQRLSQLNKFTDYTGANNEYNSSNG